LQEGFFSRRALIIDDRMTFIYAASWVEEGEIVGAGIYLRPGYLCNATTYRDQAAIATHPMLHRQDLHCKLQEAFASRELTYDTDVQRAFSSITSFFSRPDDSGDELNSQILYGNPLLSFRSSLLWRSVTPSRKRDIPSRPDGLPAIPSWSWMAWHVNIRTVKPREFKNDIYYIGQNLNEPTTIEFQCHACHRVHPVTQKSCTDEPHSSPSAIDELDTCPYLRAQRGRLGFYMDTDGDCHVVLQNPQEELSRKSDYLFFDDASTHSTLTGSEIFDFIGTCWDYGRAGQKEVYATCVRRARDRPGVFERIGMAMIHKEAWDRVAEYDENIILG
jgi:hypothetical protein